MSKKSSYFSNYESPNIVIVPTVNIVVVNKTYVARTVYDTAATAIIANTSSTSQQKKSIVSLETGGNNLVNYDNNVNVSEGIVVNLDVDASKHHSISPVLPNGANLKQESKPPSTTYNSQKYLADVTSYRDLKSVNVTSNKELLNNTNEASKECLQKNDVFLEAVDSDNQILNHPLSQINSLLIKNMASSVKPDKIKEKIKSLKDNDHKNYSHNVLQQKQISDQQPSCSSNQQPSCSSNKNINEICTNKDNDMKKYLNKLWTRRIEKMKGKCSNGNKHTNDSSKLISESKSSKTYKHNMNSVEQKYKLLNTELNNELDRYDTLSEAQKNNLTPGALKRYLDYQRFLQNYHKNLKTKHKVNNVDQKRCSDSNSSKNIHKSELKEKNKALKSKKPVLTDAPSKQKMKELNEQLTKRAESVKDMKKIKIKRKERKEEASEKSTSSIERKKVKEDLSRKLHSAESKTKKKKISSYVDLDLKKNSKECIEKFNHYKHLKKNDGISRKPHVREEDRHKTEKINNYLSRNKFKEEPKVNKIRKKPLKRLSTNVAKSSETKRKNKNVNSPPSDIRKRLTSRNLTKNSDDEMDLRSILSRKRTKSQCHGESKRFRASTPPRENLIITVKQDIFPKTSVNKKITSKPKEKKSKKLKLVINISCPRSNDSDTSNECSSPLQDLSFLDDIDIDGIVDSLDVGSTNCGSSTKEDDVENTLNNTIIEVMKNDCQRSNINNMTMDIEESKERFLVSAQNSDEESNHSTNTQQDITTQVEPVKNLYKHTPSAISLIPINDDVYEVIDITNDTEVIDLSKDQREKEDEGEDVNTLLITTKEIIEDIDDGSIILINDDSKDGIEIPHTLDNTQDNKQDLVNLNDSDVVVIEDDNNIDDMKPEVANNNHLNTRTCLESLKKVENTIESIPKLEEPNTTVSMNEENQNIIWKNKSAKEIYVETYQNKGDHHNNNVDIISKSIEIKQLDLTENVCDMDSSNDCSTIKKSTVCKGNTRILKESYDNYQLQPTVLNSKSCLRTNDELIKTEVPSKLDELRADVINNMTKTVSKELTVLITTKHPVATTSKRIKTEATFGISELQSAVLRNSPEMDGSKITLTPPVIANDKLIKTEAISELQPPANIKNNTSKLLNKNLNTQTSSLVANDKLIKTEETFEINRLQPAILKNNTKSGDSKTASNEPANLNTKTSLEAANDKVIKKEVISEIDKLQPAVTINNTESSGNKIIIYKPATINTKSAPVVENDKPLKTEATLETNKLQPAVTKNNVNLGSNKITSNKYANLNTISAPLVANDKPLKTEATLEANKLQLVVIKNNIDSGSNKITSNKSANLNTKTAPVVANDKALKTETTLEKNKLQPAVNKNNRDSCSNHITSKKSANINTKSALVVANERPLEATLEINKLQLAVVNNKTKTANYKIAQNEHPNLNIKSLPVTINEKPNKPEAPFKVRELQPAIIKNNTNKTASNGAKISPADANNKHIKKEVTTDTNDVQHAVTKNITKTGAAASKTVSNEPANINTNLQPIAATDKPIKTATSEKEKQRASSKENNTFKIPKKPTNINTKNPRATTTASNSINTENTSNIDESQNKNTNNKTISNTVQNDVKKENPKYKNPVVKTESSASNGVISFTQEDVALAPWYMKSIEKRMLDYLDQKYTVMTCVHQGYFSNIYKCKGANGQLYALKILAARFRSMGIYKDKMLTDLQKSVKDKYHLLEIINNFNFSGEWCFLTEYYPRNLQQVLESKISFHIDMVQILSRQLVAAVSTLTSNLIVHTDIKPAHILLNSRNDQLKLCGFDRSDYNYNVTIIPSFGTSSYRAPEVILGFEANCSIDVWSTALVIHEMATGSKLFPGHYNNDILYKQLSTLGALPFDMVEQSKCAYVHFYGTNFRRQIGNGKWRFEEFHGINNKLRNKLFESYHRDWAISRTNWEVTVDLDKIEMLHRLLERMLVMDPRHRIPIAFAAASEFICDYNFFFYHDKEPEENNN